MIIMNKYAHAAKEKMYVYAIIEEKNGFGRLKNGSGWVYLKKVTRI